MKWFKSCLPAVIIGLFAVPSVQADDVDDINKLVKKKVTIIFDLLGQKDADVNERNKKIVAELNEIIDFNLTAYLSLGKKNWKKLSKKQRSEFKKIFKQYINNYIVEKIALYNNQKIEIGAVNIIKKNKATLDVGFQSGGEQYQIIFKLRKNKKKKWLVWGLVIEGVSVIKTFKTQFSGVLKKDSLDVLLEKLRNSAPKS